MNCLEFQSKAENNPLLRVLSRLPDSLKHHFTITTIIIAMKISLRPWKQSGDGSLMSESPPPAASQNNNNNDDDENNNNYNDDSKSAMLVRLKDIKDKMAELSNEVSEMHDYIYGEVKLLNGKLVQLEECVIKSLDRQRSIKEEDLDNEQRRNIANGTAAEEEVNEVAAISNSLAER